MTGAIGMEGSILERGDLFYSFYYCLLASPGFLKVFVEPHYVLGASFTYFEGQLSLVQSVRK